MRDKKTIPRQIGRAALSREREHGSGPRGLRRVTLRPLVCLRLGGLLLLFASSAHAGERGRVTAAAARTAGPVPWAMQRSAAAASGAADGDGGGTPAAAAGGNETIYLRHFQLAVETVMRERAELCELFSAEERALAAPFLPSLPAAGGGGSGGGGGERADASGVVPLSREARGLYTRMLQRKGPWFRLDSLVKYDELLSDWQEGGAAAIAPVPQSAR